MRLLTATALTQGTRDNDYHWATEGELVTIDPPCDCDHGDPDNRCGCARGFAGMSSHRPTTTALVWDVDLTTADLRLALVAARQDAGWELTEAELDEEVDSLIRLGAFWDAGTVVERRADRLVTRGVLADSA
jgi:hypothetical protein